MLPRLTDKWDASPTRRHAVLRSQAGATLVHEGNKQARAARKTPMRENQEEAWPHPPDTEPPAGRGGGAGEASGPEELL